MPPNENRARHARLEILFARRVWVGTEQEDMHPAPGIVLSETKTARHYSVSALVRVCREERERRYEPRPNRVPEGGRDD